MVGFVNALAILIFLAQVPHLVDVPSLVYPMIAVGIAIMVSFPRINKVIPAPLVAIVALTGFTILAAINVPNVGDKGELPDSLPSLFIPDVPLSLRTLEIIAPYALAMALVGLLESLLTAKLVDDITDTGSDKTREAWWSLRPCIANSPANAAPHNTSRTTAGTVAGTAPRRTEAGLVVISGPTIPTVPPPDATSNG